MSLQLPSILSMTIGEIASRIPHAEELFRYYSIDYACSGTRPLGNILKEKEIHESEFQHQLETLGKRGVAENFVDWSGKGIRELTDWIVENHHDYLNDLFPDLTHKLKKLNRKHGVNHPELFDVYKTFLAIKADLEEHMAEEEFRIFPKMADWERADGTKPTLQDLNWLVSLQTDHETTAYLLKQMRTLTRDFHVPPDACKTYRYVFENLEDLEADMFTHMHLENNILFPKARAIAEEKNTGG